MKIVNNTLISIESADIKDGVLTLPKKVKIIGDGAIQNQSDLLKVVGKYVLPSATTTSMFAQP